MTAPPTRKRPTLKREDPSVSPLLGPPKTIHDNSKLEKKNIITACLSCSCHKWSLQDLFTWIWLIFCCDQFPNINQIYELSAILRVCHHRMLGKLSAIVWALVKNKGMSSRCSGTKSKHGISKKSPSAGQQAPATRITTSIRYPWQICLRWIFMWVEFWICWDLF